MRTKPKHKTMMFEDPLIIREGLKRQITEKIEKIIFEHNLEPGTRLPSERDLAQLFGVNRATVGEAINLLEQRGLVSKRHGSGTYVKAIPDSVVADSIERYFIFRNCLHEDLVAVREMQEPEIAAMAARNATAEDIARLKELTENMEQNVTKGGNVDPALDAEFHKALAFATHNDLIIAIAAGMQNLMTKWLQTQYEYEVDRHEARRGNISRRRHRLIFDAVAAHDPDLARKAMQDHMRMVRSLIKRYKRRETVQPVG